MILAIMQPYFLPYLGYFSLIKHADNFVLLDNVQFIRHGWIERNRILKPDNGWQYIRVPLQKPHRHTLIRDTRIDNSLPWQKRIIDQLRHYKSRAPYYSNALELLQSVFMQKYDDITSLDRATLAAVCRYLDIRSPIQVFSEMNLAIDSVGAPDEWALNICRALGEVTEYRNPPGGMALFNSTKYESNGIRLKFQRIRLRDYDQARNTFEGSLSIIDAIMFNSAHEINCMLDDYELL